MLLIRYSEEIPSNLERGHFILSKESIPYFFHYSNFDTKQGATIRTESVSAFPIPSAFQDCKALHSVAPEPPSPLPPYLPHLWVKPNIHTWNKDAVVATRAPAALPATRKSWCLPQNGRLLFYPESILQQHSEVGNKNEHRLAVDLHSASSLPGS